MKLDLVKRYVSVADLQQGLAQTMNPNIILKQVCYV